MSKLILVDSSVIISAFGNRDQFSGISADFFGKMETGFEILLPTLVFVEVAINLSKQGISDLDLSLDKISRLRQVALDIDSAKKSLAFLKEASLLRAGDFIIASTTAIYGATLVTWDKRLLENKICQAVTPAEFLAQI